MSPSKNGTRHEMANYYFIVKHYTVYKYIPFFFKRYVLFLHMCLYLCMRMSKCVRLLLKPESLNYPELDLQIAVKCPVWMQETELGFLGRAISTLCF